TLSQRRTVPTMKSGTSESALPKKEHWKTKQKREREQAKSPAMEKGNPDFVLTPELEADALEQFNALVDDEIVHSNAPHGTLAPITSEDREIDQMLERAAKSNPVSNLHVETPLIPEKKKRDVLRNHIAGYRPANT